MENDKLGGLIKESLDEEVFTIKMSSSLKSSIRNHTIQRPDTFMDKIIKIMNRPIETSMSVVVAACLIIFLIIPSYFVVTDNMKKDKSIAGYSNIQIINIGTIDIMIEKNDGTLK